MNIRLVKNQVTPPISEVKVGDVMVFDDTAYMRINETYYVDHGPHGGEERVYFVQVASEDTHETGIITWFPASFTSYTLLGKFEAV